MNKNRRKNKEIWSLERSELVTMYFQKWQLSELKHLRGKRDCLCSHYFLYSCIKHTLFVKFIFNLCLSIFYPVISHSLISRNLSLFQWDLEQTMTEHDFLMLIQIVWMAEFTKNFWLTYKFTIWCNWSKQGLLSKCLSSMFS